MISLADVKKAKESIQDKVLITPLVYSPTFSNMTGGQVYLKLENLQRGGSFKIRGAINKIFSYSEGALNGVVAASVGNHAQGVALAAREAGIPATIVMPIWASIAKQEATQRYGAELILKGESLSESMAIAKEMAYETGKLFIHPYDDDAIIAGQGTIGLEILSDLPDVDLILIPVGGGGLISGIAIAVKSLRPTVKVIGVQATACPSAYEALKREKPVFVEAKNSIADAIMVPQVGEANFSILQKLVDKIILVDEDQISSAVLLLLERKRILAEGAGAVPLAALLSSAFEFPKDSKAVLVVSGGNVDVLLLNKIIKQGLLEHGRIMRFSVSLIDAPGSLAGILDLMADLKANVVQISHARNEGNMPMNIARVDIELETRGLDHIRQIEEELRSTGYRINRK